MSREEIIGDATLYLGDCRKIIGATEVGAGDRLTCETSKPNVESSGTSGQQSAELGGVIRRWRSDGRSNRQAAPTPKSTIGSLEGSLALTIISDPPSALRLGHKFIGIEIEERWFSVACRRIEAEARQGRLPIDQPAPVAKPADLFAEVAAQ